MNGTGRCHRVPAERLLVIATVNLTLDFFGVNFIVIDYAGNSTRVLRQVLDSSHQNVPFLGSFFETSLSL